MTKPEISKAAFVRAYAEGARLQVKRIGKTFFETNDYRYTATRCRCGEGICEGWQMDTGRPLTPPLAHLRARPNNP